MRPQRAGATGEEDINLEGTVNDELEEKETEVDLKVPANKRCVVTPIACGRITSREGTCTRQEKTDNRGHVLKCTEDI